MIDVPIAVRDALKDGGYKKNYRFVVGDAYEQFRYDLEHTFDLNVPFTIDGNGTYRLYRDTNLGPLIYNLNGTTTEITVMYVDYAGGLYIDIGQLSIGDVITITSTDYTVSLKRLTTEKEEVFRPDFTIDNDKLVKESVKIDERMCSDDNLKFGLCEGSSLEFQAFDIENITGKRLQAFVDVKYPVYTYDYDEETDKTTKTEVIEDYSIPMGWYDVQETSRQASTGIRKVSAYNKLKSDYLDADVNALIVEEFGTTTVRVLDILQFLLRKFGIRTITANESLRKDENVSIVTDAKKSFPPYRYTDYINATSYVFTMLPWYTFENYFPSLSTNFYISQSARLSTYALSQVASGRPVQIKIDERLEQLEAIITNYIQSNLEVLAAHCNTSAAVLFERLQKSYCTTNATYTKQPQGYFFFVEVHFRNAPTLKFGNHILGADGTFEQMSRRVFVGVTYIAIVTPLSLVYGIKAGDQGVEYKEYHTSHGLYSQYDGLSNIVRMYGEPTYDLRTPPRMPDGTTIPREMEKFFKVQVLTGGYSPAELLEIDVTKTQNITLRDIQTAVFESNCQFGRLDRTNNYFSGVELNNGRLYPAEDLYPDDALYPMSQSESGFRAMYSKLWADEGNVRSWRKLIITYKGLVENEETHEIEEVEKIYEQTVNANGTDDYEVKNNWLFKNLTWADSESEDFPEATGLENIEDYSDAMVAKMTGVSWFPFEMWCAGLPYVETGDEVEINVADRAYVSYVLRRTIKGIQNLQDEMINGTLDIF